jgi:hypothetical protein
VSNADKRQRYGWIGTPITTSRKKKRNAGVHVATDPTYSRPTWHRADGETERVMVRTRHYRMKDLQKRLKWDHDAA